MAAFSSSLAGLKVVVAAVAEEFRLYNTMAVTLVTCVMLLLGTASALSFTPLDWRIAGEPILEMIDRGGGRARDYFIRCYGCCLVVLVYPAGPDPHSAGRCQPLVGVANLPDCRYAHYLVLLWAAITFAVGQAGGSGL
ncbi:MAG: hypothetical protein U5K56_02955 [Halioglobus sp.]|nr:hypothetical protein [Halioglobus sp.]